MQGDGLDPSWAGVETAGRCVCSITRKAACSSKSWEGPAWISQLWAIFSAITGIVSGELWYQVVSWYLLAWSLALKVLSSHLLFLHFKGEGITRERILVLFFFCADVSIEALKKGFHQTFRVLLDWSLKYIATRVAQWVHNHGGWVRIFIRILISGWIWDFVAYDFYSITGESASVIVGYCIPGFCMLCLRCSGHRMCCVHSSKPAEIVGGHFSWSECNALKYCSLRLFYYVYMYQWR